MMPYLLDDSAAIHVKREVDHVALHAIGKYPFLVLITMLEEFLDNIVPKYVCH